MSISSKVLRFYFELNHMLHSLCGPPSISLSFINSLATTLHWSICKTPRINSLRLGLLGVASYLIKISKFYFFLSFSLRLHLYIFLSYLYGQFNLNQLFRQTVIHTELPDYGVNQISTTEMGRSICRYPVQTSFIMCGRRGFELSRSVFY